MRSIQIIIDCKCSSVDRELDYGSYLHQILPHKILIASILWFIRGGESIPLASASSSFDRLASGDPRPPLQLSESGFTGFKSEYKYGYLYGLKYGKLYV